MVDFRKKLLGLGLLASAFTGMSYGQILCPAPNGVGQYQIQPGLAANLLRVESQTEEVSDLNIFCNTGGNFGSGNLTVTISNAAITSKGGAGAAGGASDAMLVIVTTAAVDTLVPAVNPTSTPAYYFGTVSPGIPGTVTFSNVTFPQGTPYYMSIRNIRVNASAVSTQPGANQVNEQVLVTNAGVGIFAPQTQLVGLVYQGFKPFVASSVTGTTTFLMCQGYTNAQAGVITIAENFGGAFKSLWPQGLTAASAGTCGGNPCTATNGENGTGTATYLATLVGGGFGPPAAPAAGTGLATHGTRFQVAFAGIPTGVTLSVPLTITNGTVTMNLTASATGAFNNAGLTGVLTTSAAGAATAIYEVTSTDNTVQNETTGASLVVSVTAAANYSTSGQAPFTAVVTVAPQVALTSTSDIPDFITATPAPQPLSGWNLCQTTLLFPFVSTVTGIDTGIALSNTSLDPAFIGGGGVNSTATPNQGSCALSFYGTLATAPTTAVTYPKVPAPNPTSGGATPYIQPAGTSNAFAIGAQGLVPAGFDGYMIAQCNYLYGHGFAYIAYQLGMNSGATMGYIANVLPTRPIGSGATIASEILLQ
jgi:hypothetical protein